MDRQLTERLATITEYLVAFPTVAGNDTGITGCLDWVRQHVLARAPRLRARQFVSRGKPSLLFSTGNAPPRVLLCGHLDVVEAVDHQRDFRARPLNDDYLGGRGTADMKGPVAALIDIMVTKAQSGLGLLLTTDEETGGEDGVGHFLHAVEWRPEVVILPDGGANLRLVTEQKGILRLRIHASGTAAHGARPWLGQNAIDRLYRGYQALLHAYPIPASEDDWRVSITLSQLHGGIAPNTVPWHAEGLLDIRYPGDGRADAGERLLRDIRRRLSRLQVAADVLAVAPPFVLAAGDPAVERLQRVAADHLGAPLPLARESGASDARYFSAEGVPVIMFQPECADWHAADERVNLASLAQFRTLCAAYARAMLARSDGTAPRAAARPAKTRMAGEARLASE